MIQMAIGECSAYSSLLTNPKVKFAASATSWWLALTLVNSRIGFSTEDSMINFVHDTTILLLVTSSYYYNMYYS